MNENDFNNLKSHMAISSITLAELEHIKSSNRKSEDVKFRARKITKLLNKNFNDIRIFSYLEDMIIPLQEKGLEINNDAKILASAFYFKDSFFNFFTNDISLRNLAGLFFESYRVKEYQPDANAEEEYTGYLNIQLTDEEMAYFYSNMNTNIFDLYINQYANIYNHKHELVDTVIWTGTDIQPVGYKTFNTEWFGLISPMKNDPYQKMVLDSFSRNQITLVRAPAGTGKTYLSLGFLFNQLEQHKIDKIVIFCNTVATKHSARLGFYPGTKDEKLLDSQIGNLLISKLGSRLHVEELINKEKIILLPLSDIRGYDTSGMNAGIYISEAQNLNIDLMKLAVQRIGSDCICIIDGDDKTQVDDIAFEGSNNGIRRLSQVFRGEDIYGEVQLKNIYRSRIAQIAEKM